MRLRTCLKRTSNWKKKDSKKSTARSKRNPTCRKGWRNLKNSITILCRKTREIDFDKIFPTQSGLKEIEYAPESDEDIAKRAQSAIESEKNKSQTKIKDKYQEAVDALNEDKVSARESLADSYSNLSKLYDELKEKANNDSIRRGLGRSSVATNRIDELDKQHFSSATDAEKAYAREVANIESEISKLQRDKDNALEQLDLKSAADLDESIAKLKSERDAKVEEYEKYNNDVRKKNKSFQEDRQKKIDAYVKAAEEEKKAKEKEQQEYESKNGYSGEKLENYSERYRIAYDFYSALSPDIAVDALKASPSMKYYLGNMYDRLLSSLQSKKKEQKFYF